MKRFAFFLPLLIVTAAPFGGVAEAQLALPGAAQPAPTANPDKPAKKARHARRAAKDTARTPGVESIVDKDLLLSGADGELRFSVDADGKTLRIEKLTLPGEVISDPHQKCRIDIVAETPIEAINQGATDGLMRYSADIPACPLSFDVLNGAVQVPAQTTACVFQAADCQASPSGVWGPDGASLDKDAKTLTRERLIAEASMAASQRILAKRDKTAAAALTREQTEFAAARDDACHDYAGEVRHGFCATRLTQARAALLRIRAAARKRKKDNASADN
jgi:hypothetical protein